MVSPSVTQSPHVTYISPSWESVTDKDLTLDLMETAASRQITFLAVHAPGPPTEGLTSRSSNPGNQFGLADGLLKAATKE